MKAMAGLKKPIFKMFASQLTTSFDYSHQ